MHDALTFSDLGDGLHPNATGYGKMAGAWFTALTGIVNSSAPPAVVTATSSSPAVVASGTNVSAVTDNSQAAGYPYASFFTPMISTNDLVNTGLATFSSWSRDKAPVFESTILNDGIGHPTNASLGTFMPATYGSGGKLPFTYTFNLNTNVNVYGYDLTMIRTFAGWNQNGSQLGNQKYQILVRQVGQTSAVSMGTFAYVPFDSNTAAQASSTMLTLTPTGGVLATRVDQIQFVFMDHGYHLAGNSIDGTVYTEADVFGTASSAPPLTSAVPSMVTGTNVSAATDNSAAAGYPFASYFGPWVSTNDLVNTNQATLTSWNRDKAPFFETTTLNDGRGHPTNASQGTYMPNTFGSGSKLPFTYTFILNTNASPNGYDITSVRTFAGWNQNGAQLGNQKYELLVKTAGTTNFSSLGIFAYTPFATNNTQQASATMMTVAPTQGLVLATGVAEVRFIFMDHGTKSPLYGIDGTVYFEADVFGQKTILQPPPDVTIGGSGAGDLSLSWHTNYPSFVLEKSPDLSGTNWQTAGITPATVGTNLLITISPDQSATNLFYRVRR